MPLKMGCQGKKGLGTDWKTTFFEYDREILEGKRKQRNYQTAVSVNQFFIFL